MQTQLKLNAEHVDELMIEARALAARTEEEYKAQLAEKSKQLDIVQALLAETQSTPSASAAQLVIKSGGGVGKMDRAFMDDFLISVLEQKDRLADELHTLNNAYAEAKAQLGMAEFEKERLQAECRAAARNAVGRSSVKTSTANAAGVAVSDAAASESAVLPGEGSGADVERTDTEAIAALQTERDELAAALAESNRTVQQLRNRTGSDDRSLRESERRRRKENHKAGLSIRAQNRLDELERENKRLSSELEKAQKKGGKAGEAAAEVVELQALVASKEKALCDRDASIATMEEELAMLRNLIGTSSSSSSERRALEDELAAARAETQSVNEQLQKATALAAANSTKQETTISELQQEVAAAAAHAADAAAAHGEELAQVRAERDTSLAKFNELQERTAGALQEHAESTKARASAEAEAAKVHESFLAEQERRRMLQNTLMELAGNIRVFARVRPLVGKAAQPAVRPLGTLEMQVNLQDVWRGFEFDRAFAPESDANAIFKEVEPLVASFVDGYNVCMLAYGQTGSGKTHTMLGSAATTSTDGPSGGASETMNGVIPRAMAELFRLRDAQTDVATIEVQASVLEVYNESVRDLLSDKPWEKHEVTEGSGAADVPTATTADVTSAEDVLQLVADGLSNRVERATDLNEHSSRSHLVVTVHSTRKSLLQDGVTTRARMHLVDLAGSENAKLAGNDADGAKEGKAINKSLSALSTVLIALAKQKAGNAKQHVPYRNSKLTHLLKDAIGGDAKTVMFVCVRPEQSFASESAQSLRFGSQARQIVKGPAAKNVLSLLGQAEGGGSGSESRRRKKQPALPPGAK